MRKDLLDKQRELQRAAQAVREAVWEDESREALDWLITVQLRAAELAALLVVNVVERQPARELTPENCCLSASQCATCRFSGNRCKGKPQPEGNQ